MLKRPLLFFRLQKTQLLPVGSKTAHGSRSASPPVVNAFATPQFAPSKRLYQMFQPPARRELQNSHTLLPASLNADGSLSADALGRAAGSGTPKPSLGPALERSVTTVTNEPSPLVCDTSSTRLPLCFATPGTALFIAAEISTGVAAVISAKSVVLKVTVAVAFESIRSVSVSFAARLNAGPALLSS